NGHGCRPRGPGIVTVRQIDRTELAAGTFVDLTPGDIDAVEMRACRRVVDRESRLVGETVGKGLDRSRREPRRRGTLSRGDVQPGPGRLETCIDNAHKPEVLPARAVDRYDGIAAQVSVGRVRQAGAGPRRAAVRRAVGGDLQAAMVVGARKQRRRI